jgi:hypothetical protein
LKGHEITCLFSAHNLANLLALTRYPKGVTNQIQQLLVHM